MLDLPGRGSSFSARLGPRGETDPRSVATSGAGREGSHGREVIGIDQVFMAVWDLRASEEF
jgi:hypothetical protein